MQTNIHLTARELMDKWEIDPIDLYQQIKDGLPAQCPTPLGGWQKLEISLLNPYDHDFEKHISLLRFWDRHVELWEIGGSAALAEGTRLRFPKDEDSQTPQLDGLTSPIKKFRPDPLPTKKKRKRRYHKERERARDFIRRAWKEYPEASKKWIINNRLRKYVPVTAGKKRGQPFADNTYYGWFKDELGDKPLK